MKVSASEETSPLDLSWRSDGCVCEHRSRGGSVGGTERHRSLAGVEKNLWVGAECPKKCRQKKKYLRKN